MRRGRSSGTSSFYVLPRAGCQVSRFSTTSSMTPAGSNRRSSAPIGPRTAWPGLLLQLPHFWNKRADQPVLRLVSSRRISSARGLKDRRVKKLLTIGSILLCLALPAHAQSDTPAPFDGDLERLSEIMGALHYLRAVCGANEGSKWRNELQALIDAEAPNGERRRKIVASFNRGYRGFQQTYRVCTPAADLAIRRYLDEGAKIAREITARYAN